MKAPRNITLTVDTSDLAAFCDSLRENLRDVFDEHDAYMMDREQCEEVCVDALTRTIKSRIKS